MFPGISTRYKLIVAKSRRFCEEDFDFLAGEISKLQEDGIFIPSFSPWCAPVEVIKDGADIKKNTKKPDYKWAIVKR